MNKSWGAVNPDGTFGGGSTDWTATHIGTGAYKINNPNWPANAVVIVTPDFNPNLIAIANVIAQAAGTFTALAMQSSNGANVNTYIFFNVYW